jgi:4-amino-4-deoxy-L-arabinose transferase-like glycosyltransferase
VAVGRDDNDNSVPVNLSANGRRVQPGPEALNAAMDSETSNRYSKTDFALIGMLLLAATAVRLPYLQLIPVVTDEVFEVLAALSVYQGNWILYGPVNPTAGPLATYLLALGFWLLGPQMILPRIIALILGVLTVGLTYVLGRSMGGRWAGVIAGILLAFSPIHTVVNSHIPWSNATTPFFFTLAIIVLHAAGRRHHGPLLVLGGLLFGLALQSHISLLAVIPGLLVWFLARRDIRTWMREPWPYLAAGAALLGYANMIVYSLTTGGGALADAEQHTYAWVSNPTWGTYWINLKGFLGSVALALGGQLPEIENPASTLVATILLIWLVVSLIYALWRRETMPVLVVLSTAIVMPYFNKRYSGLLSQRYIAFLMPLCFATMGLAAAHLLDTLRAKDRPARTALAAGFVVLVLLVAIYPIRTTLAHYDAENRANRNNAAALHMATTLKDATDPDTPVYLSFELAGPKASGGRRFRRSLSYYLLLEGVQNQILELPDIARELKADPSQEAWLVLTPEGYETLAQDFALEPVLGSPLAPNGGHLVRYLPAGQEP